MEEGSKEIRPRSKDHNTAVLFSLHQQFEESCWPKDPITEMKYARGPTFDIFFVQFM
jgi:hypothetical protein